MFYPLDVNGQTETGVSDRWTILANGVVALDRLVLLDQWGACFGPLGITGRFSWVFGLLDIRTIEMGAWTVGH